MNITAESVLSMWDNVNIPDKQPIALLFPESMWQLLRKEKYCEYTDSDMDNAKKSHNGHITHGKMNYSNHEVIMYVQVNSSPVFLSGKKNVTVSEAAKMLNISEKTIRRKIADNTIQAWALGSVIRITMEEIDRIQKDFCCSSGGKRTIFTKTRSKRSSRKKDGRLWVPK
jgi:excisionase family DNA binding protein